MHVALAALRSRHAAPLVLLLLVLAWTVPITSKMIVRGDFPAHLDVAASMAADPHVPVPHFLFFALVAVLMRLSLTAQAAGIAVITGLHLLTAAVIWLHFRTHASRAPIMSVLAAAAMLMVGPIFWPLTEPDQFMIGYFMLNAIHNATYIAAKPFAIMALLAGAAALSGSARVTAAGAAVIVVLGAISKPNYLLCLIPALVLQAAVYAWRGHAVKWRLVIVMVASAAVSLLIMERIYGARGLSVVVAPFAVMRIYTSVDLSLIAKLLASIAFPILVTVLWPGLLRSSYLSLAWLTTFVALAQGYLLAEAGENIGDGNLLVGAPLSIFVLFVVSAGAWLSLPRPDSFAERARRCVPPIVLLLHVASGYWHMREVGNSPFGRLTPFAIGVLIATAGWIAAVVLSRGGPFLATQSDSV